MGTDKADIGYSVGIVDPHNQSVLVTRNIENHTPAFQDTGSSKVPLCVSRALQSAAKVSRYQARVGSLASLYSGCFAQKAFTNFGTCSIVIY